MKLALIPTVLFVFAACGGGVPIELRVDELTMELPLDEAVDGACRDLLAQGFLPGDTISLPELWPDTLPDIRYQARITTPPTPLDLTPEPPAEGEEPADDKYAKINKAGAVIERIEVNRFILRVETSTLSVRLPELELQVADSPEASPEDRLAWWTVGRLPATPEPRWVGDLEFEFLPGGESFMGAELGDEAKELALRVAGTMEVDTAENPARPAGTAQLRLILVATFFVRPEGAL